MSEARGRPWVPDRIVKSESTGRTPRWSRVARCGRRGFQTLVEETKPNQTKPNRTEPNHSNERNESLGSTLPMSCCLPILNLLPSSLPTPAPATATATIVKASLLLLPCPSAMPSKTGYMGCLWAPESPACTCTDVHRRRCLLVALSKNSGP